MNEIIKLLDYIISKEDETCLREEILPLIDKDYKNNKCYDYIKAMLLKGFKNSNEEAIYDKKYYELLLKSSQKGCKEAQYLVANRLYENKDYKNAMELYRKSALQGYANSQWCYGIDLFNGIEGVLEKDEKEGLFFIELSAGQLYEYAIDFLIDLYKNGYGTIRANSNLYKRYKLMSKWV